MDKKRVIKKLLTRAKEELGVSETELIDLVEQLSDNSDFKMKKEIYDEVSPGIYRKAELMRSD